MDDSFSDSFSSILLLRWSFILSPKLISNSWPQVVLCLSLLSSGAIACTTMSAISLILSLVLYLGLFFFFNGTRNWTRPCSCQACFATELQPGLWSCIWIVQQMRVAFESLSSFVSPFSSFSVFLLVLYWRLNSEALFWAMSPTVFCILLFLPLLLLLLLRNHSLDWPWTHYAWFKQALD